MITFENGIDIRSRSVGSPTVARIRISAYRYAFCVIGTDYGHVHTASGDVRIWGSESGARAWIRARMGADINSALRASRFGAPLGAVNCTLSASSRYYLQRVYVDSRGYAPNGRYWGAGEPLYCAFNSTDRYYLRAASRRRAITQLRATCPGIKFIRGCAE